MTLEPIGTFHAGSKYPYEARRQASVDTSNALGEIRLHEGRNFEQALEDLEGFERIWVVYHFHQNQDWKPKVMPPRGPRAKRGVFATRAPYRPNAIGLSCVRLIKVEGLKIIVEGHDLLDGSPVLDIKPYLPYADAFPGSKVGWLEDVDSERWQIEFSADAESAMAWLESHGVIQLRGFIQGQLEFDPFDHKRKRVEKIDRGFKLSYRTWRVHFDADAERKRLVIKSICSGYSQSELADDADPYADKNLHRRFSAIN